MVVLAAALAAATAACSSGGSSSPGATGTTGASGTAGVGTTGASDPLAGLNSQQIAAKAVSGTEAATAVRITGTGTDSGQTVTLDLTEVKGKGCFGTIAEGKIGSFKLVYNGTDVWVLPDAAFYAAENVPAAAKTILDGKYIEVSASDASLGSMSSLCSMTSLLSKTKPDASLSKGVKTTYNGQSVYKITDKTGAGVAYVSDSSPSQILYIDKSGSDGGQLTFTYYTTPPAITPPPASQTIDGSKYGF